MDLNEYQAKGEKERVEGALIMGEANRCWMEGWPPQEEFTSRLRPTVYLAGHITEDNYRRVASTYLDTHGWNVLDPFKRADYRDRENLDMAELADEIVEGDLKDIRQSKAVLADCTHGSPGTSMEIWFAYSIGRPVYAFVEKGGRISPWVHYAAHGKVEETLADALVRLVGEYP